ncbi:MAG: hypothetical protein ACLFWL_06865 [Candidatus Brocadiia bacterium]
MAQKIRFKNHMTFFLISLTVHLIIFGVLAVLGVLHDLSGLPITAIRNIPQPVEITSVEVELDPKAFVDVDDRKMAVNLKQIYSKTKRELGELSNEEKMRRLRRKMKQLERVRPRSIEAIAGAVEAWKGIDSDRAYAPKKEAEGKFDPDSASLYDIRRLQKKNGEVVYVFILVDRAGQTLTNVVKEENMAPRDLRAYQIFKMGSDNPALRRLIETTRKIHASTYTTPAPQKNRTSSATAEETQEKNAEKGNGTRLEGEK